MLILNRIAVENDRIAGVRNDTGNKITVKKKSDEQQKQQQRRLCDDSDEEGGVFLEDFTSEEGRIEALLAKCPGVVGTLRNKLETLFDLMLQPTIYTYGQTRDQLLGDPP